jgi:hypothetical protein
MAFSSYVVKSQRNRPAAGEAVVRSWIHTKSAAVAPTAAAVTKFTITGGRIIVHFLIGEVTTIMQASACNTKVTINPTTGTSADVASNLDVTGDEAGTLYKVEADGTALVGTDAGTGWAAAGLPNPFIVPAGTLDVEHSAAITGAIKWDLYWEPLDEGADVTGS